MQEYKTGMKYITLYKVYLQIDKHLKMGAARVTPQEIVEMHRLYKDLGNYAAVGR